MSNLLSVPEAKATASSISDLPAEIVTEILLRLPAGYLLICQSVCKPFFNLIKSPNFIYEHLSRTKIFNVESLLLNLYCDGVIEFLVSIDKNTNDIISYSYLTPLFPIAGCLVIRGSCNGLLCGEIITYGYDNDDNEIITTEDEIPRILLWNPATRQSRYLPKPQLHCFPCYPVDLAFGFVPETNDYKIVWIVFYVKMQIEVYRMSTDSWTTIEYNMSMDDSILSGEDLNPCETSIFLNGAFHWGKVGTGGICSFILSFNLKDEEVWLLRALDNDSYYFEHFWRLAVVDESLSLIYIKIGIGIDIWVMNDYGVQDSWALRYRVVDGILKDPWPVQYWTNGLVLIVHETDLERRASLYDPNTREIKYFSALEDFCMKEFPTLVHISVSIYTFFSYVETLVPVSQHRE